MTDFIVKIIIFLISLIDKFERDDEKLIHSFNINNISIKTDTGFIPLSHIHLTKPFDIYSITLENGYFIDCADTHIVFNQFMEEVFVKDLSAGDIILTDCGPKRVISIKHNSTKICMCDVTVDDDNHRFYSNGILSHNTTTSAIYMLWYVLFNFDKNALVIADVRKHAIEILDKTKKIFYELPYFLKPGVNKWNENEIVLDNGCRIMASATTITAAISYTFHEILWDEAAHLAANIQEKFYNNLFPTITAAKAKFMITSTQNGYNLFYRLYKAAELGENEYAPFKTDWYEVPEWNPEKRCWEERDEQWHQMQIANYGSEEAFNSQFGTEFDVGAKTLLHRNTIRKLRQNVVEYVYKELPGVSQSENYHWRPDYEPSEQLRNDFIIITGDLSEGVNKDYNHFNISRLIEPGSGKIENIGYYRSNNVDRRDVAKTIMELIAVQCNYNNTLLSFERNTYGEFFLKLIEELRDDVPGFDMSCVVKYYNDTNTKFEYGIKITRGNKNTACILFKEDFEKGLITNNDTLFVTEIGNFTDSEDKGIWKAAFGHDDDVMSMVQIEFVKKTLQYILLKQDFDSSLSQTKNSNPYDFGMNPFESYFGTQSYNTIYDVSPMPNNFQQMDYNMSQSRLNRFS